MNVIEKIQEEPIVILDEVKIQSVVDEKNMKKWLGENLKNIPPANTTEAQRSSAQEKINKIKQLKTNNKTNPV